MIKNVFLASMLFLSTALVWAKSTDKLEVSYLNQKMGTLDHIEVSHPQKDQWLGQRWKNSSQVQKKNIREFDYLRLKFETELFLKEKKSQKIKEPAQSCTFEFQLQSLAGCADKNPKFLKLWHDYVEIFY